MNRNGQLQRMDFSSVSSHHRKVAHHWLNNDWINSHRENCCAISFSWCIIRPSKSPTNWTNTNHFHQKFTAKHHSIWSVRWSIKLKYHRTMCSLTWARALAKSSYKWPARSSSKAVWASNVPRCRHCIPSKWIWHFDDGWDGLAKSTTTTNWLRATFWATNIARKSIRPQLCSSTISHSGQMWTISWRSVSLIYETVPKLFLQKVFAHSIFESPRGKRHSLSN